MKFDHCDQPRTGDADDSCTHLNKEAPRRPGSVFEHRAGASGRWAHGRTARPIVALHSVLGDGDQPVGGGPQAVCHRQYRRSGSTSLRRSSQRNQLEPHFSGVVGARLRSGAMRRNPQGDRYSSHHCDTEHGGRAACARYPTGRSRDAIYRKRAATNHLRRSPTEMIDVVAERASTSPTISASLGNRRPNLDMARRVGASRPGAILILCTNLRGAQLVEQIEREVRTPVLDSVVLGLLGGLRSISVDFSHVPHAGEVCGWTW